MKIQSIALFIAFVAFIMITASAQEDKRSALLQRRNIGGRPSSKGTSTTVVPAEPEYEDEDYNEQENPAAEKQEQHQEQETTTTEAPKRIMPSVRPFRSNDDLLAALKKRRQQVKSQPQQQPKTVTQKQPEFHRIQEDEEKEATKPQSTKSTKASPAAHKKRTFGNTKASPKLSKKEAEPAADEPTPSASSPLAERVGRSRFNFNRGARL